MTLSEAIKYCEEHDCEECCVEDKRTPLEKQLYHIPCYTNLLDEETRKQYIKEISI